MITAFCSENCGECRLCLDDGGGGERYEGPTQEYTRLESYIGHSRQEIIPARGEEQLGFCSRERSRKLVWLCNADCRPHADSLADWIFRWSLLCRQEGFHPASSSRHVPPIS